jgi:hypothetical protein
MKKGISTRSFQYDKGLRMNKHTVLQIEENDFGMVAYRQGSSVGMSVRKGDVVLFEDTKMLTYDNAMAALSLLLSGTYPEGQFICGYYPKKRGFVAFYGIVNACEVEEFTHEGEAVAYALGLNHVHQGV